MLELSATQMAELIARHEISSVELVSAHLEQITKVNGTVNAVTQLLEAPALEAAKEADAMLARGETRGPLHGVPFSIKDSIDVKGCRSTAGTWGRKDAEPASCDATLVARLRAAGAIPIAKTNLPDLLFSFETDNLIYGRTNNPYDLTRSAGGSSGGESALLAACGSPLGLGSDALGSVRVPAAFCGVASIKPTSGRLPRTGHVPAAGGWLEAVWQMGPMARRVEDLALAMQLLAYPDEEDFTSPPMPLFEAEETRTLCVAFFTDNGFARCSQDIQNSVRKCASFLAGQGMTVTEERPPGIEDVYELELALFGADGTSGIKRYLAEQGSDRVHPYLTAFLDHMCVHKTDVQGLARRWRQWDEYRKKVHLFFRRYDVVVCPVYTQVALPHGGSLAESNFQGFSYTMAWSTAGTPAATVRCAESSGLPVNVQVVAPPWRDMRALAVCRLLEQEFGGWKAPQASPEFGGSGG